MSIDELTDHGWIQISCFNHKFKCDRIGIDQFIVEARGRDYYACRDKQRNSVLSDDLGDL